MEIINHLGDKFEINISNYHYENNHSNQFDSDWLDADLILKNGNETFKINLEFLIIEELEKMVHWLSKILEDKTEKKTLLFVDPNLKFRVMTRSKINVLKVIYEIDEFELAVWELIITKENILSFIDQLREDLRLFPCRFLHNHEVN